MKETGTSGRFGLVGESEPMLEVHRGIARAARSDAEILITGESGTGKELVARAVHENSRRRARPFVVVNCAALPPELIYSELFGHERGAFTGAHERRLGRIELAHGGTLLLDELGDLPAPAQATLLRFLNDHTITRLGDHRTRRVDVRVIASTNADLELMINGGRMRADLFYRIDVLRLRIPPLRERGADIERLAVHFLADLQGDQNLPARRLGEAVLGAMRSYPWPGNVRELKNRVRRAGLFAPETELTPQGLGIDRRTRPRGALSLESARTLAERETIMAGLRLNRNNITRTAQQLRISRTTLYRMMRKCDIAASR